MRLSPSTKFAPKRYSIILRGIKIRLNTKLMSLHFLTATGLIVSGCAATAPDTGLELKPLAKKNEAIVYFYRPKNSLSGFEEKHPPNIYVNQNLLGGLPNGAFKAAIIKELENKTVSVHKTEKDRSYSGVIIQQDFDFSGAARYFVKLQYTQDKEPELVVVNEAAALEEMRKLKAMATEDEKDGIIKPNRKSLLY